MADSVASITTPRRSWHYSRRLLPLLAFVLIVGFGQEFQALTCLSLWALLTENGDLL